MTILTESAAKKVEELAFGESETHKLSKAMFRAYVEGGGCSGMSYGFKFENHAEEGDTEITVGNTILLIDPFRYPYLVDATIDYQDNGLNGASFIIRNPNEKSRCGCGNSFSS